ncbi:MAG: hypothetical protein IJY52_04460, partial [Anaerotignum sp.]|nr:hypothetical protein [Anaerotignum sp.]
DAKEITQIPFMENELLQNIVKAAAAVTKGELRNMSRTTTVGIKTKNGFQPLGSFYKKTVDEAISAVATGTLDYNSAVRQAIKDMGESGLRVRYESGYTRRLDSAIRQNIIDGVGYIAQETAKQAGEEFGADGVELSAHSPCAPDHLPYQGKQYSMKEYDELQATLKRPIGEWNCRHFPYPILLGISRPANSKAELAEMERESNRKIEIDGKEYTRYECTQMQRKLETKLRYAREEKAIYQAAGQSDLVREATEKMRILGNKYKEVSEKAGLPTRAERMRVFSRRKTVEKADERGIIKKRRDMAQGMRKSSTIPLSDADKSHLMEEINAIQADTDVFVFRDYVGTGYSDKRDKVYISSNVFPSQDGSKHPRDLMSERAALAHEYYGHRANRNSTLEPGSWNDEFRASYFAERDCPNLSDEDRRYLILDAVERAKEAGVSIEYNDFMRRVVYGY